MKKIVIKEIDKLQSTLFNDKVITEYLIYYIENDVKKATFIELGDAGKDNKISEIFETYCMKNKTGIFHEIEIEVIKFDDHKNNKINE